MKQKILFDEIKKVKDKTEFMKTLLIDLIHEDLIMDKLKKHLEEKIIINGV